MNDEKAFGIFFVTCALLSIASIVGLFVIAIHFLGKWW